MKLFEKNLSQFSSSRAPMSIGPWRSRSGGIPRNDNRDRLGSGVSSLKEGFTLLELLVAVGVISMIVVVLTEVFFSVAKSNSKVGIQSETKQSGDYALSVMDRMIRNARSVTSTCDGITNAPLAVVNPDGNLTTFSCVTDATDPLKPYTRIASDSSALREYLTSSSVTVGTCATSLSFVCTPSTGLPSKIKISFTLLQRATTTHVYEQSRSSFESTINLRN